MDQKQQLELLNTQIDFLQDFHKRVSNAIHVEKDEKKVKELDMEWQVWCSNYNFSHTNENDLLQELIIQRHQLTGDQPSPGEPTRKPLRVENVLKVIDIDINALSSATLDYLQGRESWKDCDGDMNEHIYDVNEIIEEDQGLNYPEIQNDLNDMALLMDQNDAGLVRIITG